MKYREAGDKILNYCAMLKEELLDIEQEPDEAATNFLKRLRAHDEAESSQEYAKFQERVELKKLWEQMRLLQAITQLMLPGRNLMNPQP
uniref:Uncharacterized protein n=1 Tax=Romanomermis culicivorax TaxID=13658 RepID=A0A915K8U7_ROMCU